MCAAARRQAPSALPRKRHAAHAGLLALLWAQSVSGQSVPSPPGAAPTPSQVGTVPSIASGTVSGEIVDHDGALVAGAAVVLSQAGNAAQSHAITDSNGQFTLRNVPAGPFVLRITRPGFNPFTESGTLLPGETLDLPGIVLSVAMVSISVEAITEEQAALEELHTEEHQRLAGILPNFFVSYNWVAPPLTWRQKYALATHNVLDPGNLALSGVTAGVQQAANAFPGYRQGAAGYGKRFGADLANLVVGSYMGGAVLPAAFHQDPRYFFKGTGSKESRALYAISRAVITRGDNGRNQPNFAGVLGDLSAAALSNVYYPASSRQGATLFFENGILAVGGDALNDLVQEFVFNHITTRGKKVKTQP